MPNIEIMTHDGKTLSAPLPEGVDPSMVTPEIVAQIAQQAGIGSPNIASHNPGAGIQGPDGAPTVDPATPPGSMLQRAGGAILRAAKDRTVDPLATVFSMDPRVGTWDRLMAEGQIIGTMMAPGLTAAGGAVQAGAETMGADPSSARLLGAVTEIGGAIMNMARSVRGIGSSVRALSQGAKVGLEEIARPGLSRGEAVGEVVQRAVREKFGSLNAQFGAQFNRTEAAIKAATPTIKPGSPGYDEINGILNYVDDAAASAGPRADALVRKIRNQVFHTKNGVLDPQEVSMDDVISLRKILNERAGVAKTMDPDASIVGKKAAEMRDRTMDVVRAASPEDLARGYDELRASARTQLYTPERFLTALTNQKTTPLKAFKSVFVNNDPNMLRTVGEVMEKSPSLTAKLRFGVVEAMQDALTDAEAGGRALKRLDTFEPTLTHLNLFKPEEIEAMRFMLKSNQTPSLIRELTSNARSSQVLLRGTFGASLATHLSSSPLALGIGALAFGGLPQMRRAAMLPAGSKAQKQLLGSIIRQTATGLKAMFGDDNSTNPAVTSR